MHVKLLNLLHNYKVSSNEVMINFILNAQPLHGYQKWAFDVHSQVCMWSLSIVKRHWSLGLVKVEVSHWSTWYFMNQFKTTVNYPNWNLVNEMFFFLCININFSFQEDEKKYRWYVLCMKKKLEKEKREKERESGEDKWLIFASENENIGFAFKIKLPTRWKHFNLKWPTSAF